MKLRGQAWIVFEEVAQAVKAREKLQGKLLCSKELKIHFAKAQSDASNVMVPVLSYIYIC